MLSEKQLQLLAETLSNIGVVIFGSVVVPIFFVAVIDFFSIIGGFMLAVIFWFASLLLLR